MLVVGHSVSDPSPTLQIRRAAFLWISISPRKSALRLYHRTSAYQNVNMNGQSIVINILTVVRKTTLDSEFDEREVLTVKSMPLFLRNSSLQSSAVVEDVFFSVCIKMLASPSSTKCMLTY